MPRGGKRVGAGRKPGAKDRALAVEVQSLSALARVHTPLALKTLAEVAEKGQSDAAKVSAATAILDRGYGRPMQTHEHAGPGGGSIKHDLSVLPDEQLAQLRSIIGSLALLGGDRRGNPQEGGVSKR